MAEVTPTVFWLETMEGVRELLKVTSHKEAYDYIRPIYDNTPEEEDVPPTWLFRREPDDEEDYVLVPGGPAGEEFTWMPRSMWDEGGPLGPLLSDDPNKCPNCMGYKKICDPKLDNGLTTINCPACEGSGVRKHKPGR